jgi:hypothetical protein
MLNRSKAYAAVLLTVTFLVGAAVGGVTFRALDRPDRRPPPERRERPSYTDRLERELGLTTAQRESVQVILERREGAMDDLWRDMAPRFDTLRVRINQEIMNQLTDEQRQRFEELLARADSARRHGRDRGKR